jgi:hypothetical protein
MLSAAPYLASGVPDVENVHLIVPDAIKDHIRKPPCDQRANIRNVGYAPGVWKIGETVNELLEKPLDVNG